MDEKERMLILGFLMFLLFGVFSMLDGWFTVKAVQPYEWANLRFWLWVMFILLAATGFLIASASILADNHPITEEDIMGALLLFVQPWVLLWGGLLDAISRTVQEYLWQLSPSWVGEAFFWTWIDPPATNNIPMLPYLLSRAFGSISTTSYGVLLGSVLSILIVIGLWSLYYEYM